MIEDDNLFLKVLKKTGEQGKSFIFSLSFSSLCFCHKFYLQTAGRTRQNQFTNFMQMNKCNGSKMDRSFQLLPILGTNHRAIAKKTYDFIKILLRKLRPIKRDPFDIPSLLGLLKKVFNKGFIPSNVYTGAIVSSDIAFLRPYVGKADAQFSLKICGKKISVALQGRFSTFQF